MNVDSTFVIFLGDSTSIGCYRQGVASVEAVDTVGPSDIKGWASTVKTTMEKNGYHGQGAVIALSSALCLSATFSARDLPNRSRRQFLAFRLEEYLPYSVEDLVFDFVGANDHCLGIAAQWETVGKWVRELESIGVTIELIAPTAILAAQKLALDFPNDANPIILFENHSGAYDALQLNTGRPNHWFSTTEIETASMHIRYMGLQSHDPMSLLTAGCSATTLKYIQTLPEISRDDMQPYQADRNESAEHLATQAAYLIRIGKIASWIQLRRDRLAPPSPWRPVRNHVAALFSAAAVFLLSIALALIVQANRYRSASRQSQDQVADIFKQVFGRPPDSPNVRGRLVSEERRLSALSGDSVDDPMLNDHRVLSMLNELLRSLPRQTRFRITELRFSGADVQLEGQTRSHGDADVIADQLRRIGGFTVQAPHSENLVGENGRNEGVSFTISAARSSKPSGPTALAAGGTP